jgi:hypothetical protein
MTDIIIKNKKQKTCTLIDVAIPADRNVVQKEGGAHRWVKGSTGEKWLVTGGSNNNKNNNNNSGMVCLRNTRICTNILHKGDSDDDDDVDNNNNNNDNSNILFPSKKPYCFTSV